MVKAFHFSCVPSIRFKPGALADLPAVIKNYGTRVALVTGKDSFHHSPSSAKLLSAFDTHGITHTRIIISGEPSPAVIDQATGALNEKSIDAVVAIGGGSVLDAGKAVSAMYHIPGSVKEYLEGVGTKTHPGTKLPFIAIPTTSGTGSEATNNSVISETGKNGFKRSLRHPNFIPDVALVDPELTLLCPPDITAASGMDCFTQLTEAFLSDRSGNFTDALAIEGLKEVKTSLQTAYLKGDDLNARAGMSFAALVSGICLANAGLGTVHGFASAIGGMFNIPHGLVCGKLMAPANEISVRELREQKGDTDALIKYTRLGRIFLNEQNKSDDFYIDGFISYLQQMSDFFSLPGFNQYGINEEDIESLCEITENKNNPVKLSKENMAEILRQVL